MIQTKEDLKRYIRQDRLMNGVPERTSFAYKIIRLLVPDLTIKYLFFLRKEEFYSNVCVGGGILRFLYRYKRRNLGIKLGYSIPINVFGPGLSLPHYGTIVVSKNAKVGENCRLHASTNIGASAGKPEAPIIGDNVYIGPGAILFGNITIADNVTIAANATVNKSCEVQNVVLAGTPAKVVKEEYECWVKFNKIVRSTK